MTRLSNYMIEHKLPYIAVPITKPAKGDLVLVLSGALVKGKLQATVSTVKEVRGTGKDRIISLVRHKKLSTTAHGGTREMLLHQIVGRNYMTLLPIPQSGRQEGPGDQVDTRDIRLLQKLLGMVDTLTQKVDSLSAEVVRLREEIST